MMKKSKRLFVSRLEEFDDAMLFNTNLSVQVKVPSEVKIWNKKASEIQAHFDFAIPNYILDEIMEHEDKDNLYCLINCAVMNSRITLENAKKIREVY